MLRGLEKPGMDCGELGPLFMGIKRLGLRNATGDRGEALLGRGNVRLLESASFAARGDPWLGGMGSGMGACDFVRWVDGL